MTIFCSHETGHPHFFLLARLKLLAQVVDAIHIRHSMRTDDFYVHWVKLPWFAPLARAGGARGDKVPFAFGYRAWRGVAGRSRALIGFFELLCIPCAEEVLP